MRKHPKFLPPNFGRKKRVKERWRKPMGIDNKKRISKKIMGASPTIGWRSPRDQRDIHPSGLRELLVRNLADLSGASNVVIRIAASVGSKKKMVILEKAKSMKLRVLNSAVETKEKNVSVQPQPAKPQPIQPAKQTQSQPVVKQ